VAAAATTGATSWTAATWTASSATAGATATTGTASPTAARPAAARGTGAWAAAGAATATRAAATRAATATTTTAGETATAERPWCADVAASDTSIEFNGFDPAVLVQQLDAILAALQVRIQNFSPQMCGSNDPVEGRDGATAVEVVDAILFKAIAKAVLESGCRSTRQQCRTRHEERC